MLAPSYRGLGDQVVDGRAGPPLPLRSARPWETLTHDQTAPDRIREHPHYLGLVPSYVAAGARAAARLARTRRIRRACTPSGPFPTACSGSRRSASRGVPLVSTFFGVELTWMESQLPFLRPILRRIARGSDAVTVISSYTAAQLRRSVPGARPVVIPFGATVEPPADVARPVRRTGPLRLLFVGRLVERKGVHRAPGGARAAPDPGAVRLSVVGDGPERSRARALAPRRSGVSDRVDFAGFVPAEGLQRALRRRPTPSCSRPSTTARATWRGWAWSSSRRWRTAAP